MRRCRLLRSRRSIQSWLGRLPGAEERHGFRAGVHVGVEGGAGAAHEVCVWDAVGLAGEVDVCGAEEGELGGGGRGEDVDGCSAWPGEEGCCWGVGGVGWLGHGECDVVLFLELCLRRVVLVLMGAIREYFERKKDRVA